MPKKSKAFKKLFNQTHEKDRSEQADESFVVLDNPDDGELFDTGDVADFAGDRSNVRNTKSGSDADRKGRKLRRHPK